ncbi:hypothetical protein NDU88_004474 [Pleurodeles waltl]|uniref:Uncharacterized protein n=1 Tax=Pleurodeles waltl TaxID=8319 RepID=A0AAV7VH73_PLEWA|nr:hypothetical protein NDU88_004474 [Pleurodeles waltl]
MPAGSGVPETQQSGGIALTKEDFLSSLCTFKVELQEELTADFKSALEALQSDITSRMTSLQADVDSVGTHTLDLKTQVQEIKQQCGEVAAVLGLQERSVDNGLAGQGESRRREESLMSPVGDHWRLPRRGRKAPKK